MRILLIAYEFPPSPSPQSLRWAYLCRELDRIGHELHVLTADLGGTTPGLPEVPERVHLHATYPGPLRGLVARSRKRRARSILDTSIGSHTAPSQAEPTASTSRRGWKLSLWEGLQSMAARVLFPDMRGEWTFWGKRELNRLLRVLRPDVVISSHEPANTLQLGLLAKQAGIPLIADLGDPVLAGYTPEHWRPKSLALESEICTGADHVLVTTAATCTLLRDRHGDRSPITVLTQGFDDGLPPAGNASTDTASADRPLELLYTGSLYAFRRIDALLDALRAAAGLRLNLAAISLPDTIVEFAKTHPDKLRLLGFLPHLDALAWQRRADVLVNLANADPAQVPGKFYEYLGSGRPILHLCDKQGDAAAQLILERRRGWVCPPSADTLTAMLASLRSLHASGRLDEGLALDRSGIAEFSWQHLAHRLDAILKNL